MEAQQLRFEFQRDRTLHSKGEACGEQGSVCQVTAASERTEPIKTAVMEEVVRRENLKKALKRVCAKPLKVAMPNRFFAENGLLSLINNYESLAKTI